MWTKIISYKKNEFEIVVCKMSAIYAWTRCIKEHANWMRKRNMITACGCLYNDIEFPIRQSDVQCMSLMLTMQDVILCLLFSSCFRNFHHILWPKTWLSSGRVERNNRMWIQICVCAGCWHCIFGHINPPYLPIPLSTEILVIPECRFVAVGWLRAHLVYNTKKNLHTSLTTHWGRDKMTLL